LAIWRQALGGAHPDTAQGYHNLALNLNAQGKYGEAEPLYQKSLAIWRQALGEAHPHTALSYSGLALNLNAQGNMERPSRCSRRRWQFYARRGVKPTRTRAPATKTWPAT
jgi:hypothetical protein